MWGQQPDLPTSRLLDGSVLAVDPGGKAFALSKPTRAANSADRTITKSPWTEKSGDCSILFFILYGVLFVTISSFTSTLIICPITLFYLGERSWKRLPLYLYVYLLRHV